MREGANVKAWVWAFGAGFLVTLPLLFFDYGGEENAELKRAVRAVRYLADEMHVRPSSFWAIEGDKTPEEFIDWMFSPIGSAEWAPAGPAERPRPLVKQAPNAIPRVPRSVRIVAEAPEAGAGRQLVLKADSERGLIVAEAYEDPGGSPAFTEEWPLLEDDAS